MYAVRLSRNQSGLLGSGTAFREKRQMRHGRWKEGSEDGGGQDKREDSRRELSHWRRNGFWQSRALQSRRWLSKLSELPVSPRVLK
jgi:hypothetical protein